MIMLKYDHQLTELKTRLPESNRILIVLPQNLNTDNLAAGLSLYLSLKSAGKSVDIVSTGTTLVSQSNLYGIGEIKNDIPKSAGGNFIISLDGVVDNTGTMQQVPALEKLDWYPEGSKLNLVFHVVPGQKFVPTNITSRHDQSGYDLTIVIGCQNLNELGDLFISNSQYFAQSQVVNIDTNTANAYFGFANVIDPQSSSLSEITAQILPSLTLSLDKDAASNIIAGIYEATNNLTVKVGPTTFLVLSEAVQTGGFLPQTQSIDQTQIPELEAEAVQPQAQSVPQPQVTVEPQAQNPFIQIPPQVQFDIPAPAVVPQAPVDPVQPQPAQSFNFQSPQPVTGVPQEASGGFDLRQIFQIPQMPSESKTAGDGFIPADDPIAQPAATPQTPSQEERPTGEYAHSPNPEIESTPTPDWLVPKIFKGGNLG